MDKNDNCLQGERNAMKVNKEDDFSKFVVQRGQKSNKPPESLWLGRASKTDFRQDFFKMLRWNSLLIPFGGLGLFVMLGGVFAISGAGCAVFMWVIQLAAKGFRSVNSILDLIWVSLAVLFFGGSIILRCVMVPYWQAKVCRVRDMGGNPYNCVIKPLKIQSTTWILISFLLVSFGRRSEWGLPIVLYTIGIHLVLRRLVFLPYKKAATAISPPEKGSTSWGDYILLGFLLVWADLVFSEEFKAVKFNSVDDSYFLLYDAIWIFTSVFYYVALLSILYEVVVFIKCLVCKSKKTQLADDVMDTEKDSGGNV